MNSIKFARFSLRSVVAQHKENLNIKTRAHKEFERVRKTNNGRASSSNTYSLAINNESKARNSIHAAAATSGHCSHNKVGPQAGHLVMKVVERE